MALSVARCLVNIWYVVVDLSTKYTSTIGSYANKLYHQILDVLVKVLSLKNRKHLLESNLQTIIIDVTEQPIERPTKGQRVYYSGKKNGTL